MLNMLRINEFFINDHIVEDPLEYETWQPEDAQEIDEWIQVLVGPESGGGHWFQIHICNNNSIRHIKDKKYIFKINSWENVDNLIMELEEFIKELLPDGEASGKYYEKLSRHWLWEYATNS
jgi:hypothetical protein